MEIETYSIVNDQRIDRTDNHRTDMDTSSTDNQINQNDATTYVCPGQRLGHIEDFIPGEGTYVRKQHIHASVVGVKVIIPSSDNSKLVLNIMKEKEPSIVPDLHSVVTARVTKVNPRFASVVILCVGTKVLKEAFPGIIRSQDVRATEQDKIEIYKCFRPGDIVKAEVISLGDSRSYFLSTSKNELGVIFAKSVAGATMIPISWDSMQCPKTKMKEFRKVAKLS